MSTSAKKACVSCGASLNAGAQFCHACGAPQAAEQKALPLPVLLIGGFLGLVVVVVVAYNAGRASVSGPGSSAGPLASTMGGGSGAAPDISTLSPREQADRLFEVVMTAHENGDFARVNQFVPMAIQAYGLLGPLDPDAHYHVGLMSAISGNVAEARARVDSIRAVVPNHLLATMLANTSAQMDGDSAAAAQAVSKFLQDYQAEIASNRVEYQLHDRAIQSFLARAQSTDASN